MWPRRCSLAVIVLALGLVATRRRLAEVQAELERLSAEARKAGGAEPVIARSEPRGSEAASSGKETPETTAAVPDLAAEWEQAVPPMDS
jgi:hypothetical protein